MEWLDYKIQSQGLDVGAEREVCWGVQIMENKAMRKLVKGRSEEILLIEHRRAHNICIELAGVRMPFAAIKARPLVLHPQAPWSGYLRAPECLLCEYSPFEALAPDVSAWSDQMQGCGSCPCCWGPASASCPAIAHGVEPLRR